MGEFYQRLSCHQRVSTSLLRMCIPSGNKCDRTLGFGRASSSVFQGGDNEEFIAPAGNCYFSAHSMAFAADDSATHENTRVFQRGGNQAVLASGNPARCGAVGIAKCGRIETIQRNLADSLTDRPGGYHETA